MSIPMSNIEEALIKIRYLNDRCRELEHRIARLEQTSRSRAGQWTISNTLSTWRNKS